MLEEFLLQFFDTKPRRATSLYMLLIAKKTVSMLYAALEHDQLQWLQLYPTLGRSDFQAAIAKNLAQGKLQETGSGLVKVQGQTPENLLAPSAYQPWMGLGVFAPRLYLAVQSVSEASFDERHYAPISRDWQTQQWVRRWYGQGASTFAAELAQALAQLPQAAGDLLASRFVGHNYVGAGSAEDLAGQLRETSALAQLLQVIAAGGEQTYPSLWALWGGPADLMPATNHQAMALLSKGQTPQQISYALHLKASTVNEHIQTAALFGEPIPLGQLYPPRIKPLFDAQAANASGPYQALLAAIPGSNFFQVRLFQILCLESRWPLG